jgi:hypothetical protein
MNNEIMHVINSIPNLEDFLNKLNITFNKFQHLLQEHNYTLVHNNQVMSSGILSTNYLVPVTFVETNKNINTKTSFLSSMNIMQLIFIFYFMLILYFPMLNKSKKVYTKLIDKLKYKLLYPMYLGIVLIPILAFNSVVGAGKLIIRKYKHIDDILIKNEYKIEKDDNELLLLQYGFLGRLEYPNLFKKIDNYNNAENDEENQLNNI